jgi:hypothetical protein
MSDMKKFYERNDHVINSDVNVLFEELLDMNPPKFEEWVIRMRREITRAWDAYGCPPRTGKNEKEIIDSFNKLESYPVHQFTHTDELSDVDDDVIINKSRAGVEVDQWFSNMFKTRINYNEKDDGYSIYDLLADDKYLDRVVRGASRHLRRDSFYSHALSAIKHSKKYSIVDVSSGDEWMDTYFKNPELFKGYDFMLEEVKIRDGLNSSYFQLEQSDILQLTDYQVEMWKDLLSYRHHSTFDIENLSNEKLYAIRIYKKGNRIFPSGFKCFRIGYIQPAVNFPPMTAKYLYERFTNDIKSQETIKIFDPSSGWGGRILGAMCCRDDRNILYVGTDPNPDNFHSTGGSKYADVGDFYNTRTYRGNPFFSSTNNYEIYQLGSEEIHNDADFQKHRGSIDLVFTSPPYFNREAYSEDENQSYKKYGSSYQSWRDGFLRPTLKNCVDWLHPERYLLWNVADIKVKDAYLPLEEDSKNILEEYGMVYKYTLKMAMESMPGQNRLDENGIPKCKNFCKVDGRYLKYEPVFVFWKPK